MSARSPRGGSRERMLAGLPVAERRLDLAGVATAVLEGGEARRWSCFTAASSAAGRSGRLWWPGSPSATAS